MCAKKPLTSAATVYIDFSPNAHTALLSHLHTWIYMRALQTALHCSMPVCPYNWQSINMCFKRPWQITLSQKSATLTSKFLRWIIKVPCIRLHNAAIINQPENRITRDVDLHITSVSCTVRLGFETCSLKIKIRIRIRIRIRIKIKIKNKIKIKIKIKIKNKIKTKSCTYKTKSVSQSFSQSINVPLITKFKTKNKTQEYQDQYSCLHIDQTPMPT